MYSDIHILMYPLHTQEYSLARKDYFLGHAPKLRDSIYIEF